MHLRRRTHAALLCALPALALAACQAETLPPSERDSTASAALSLGAEMPAHFDRVVPWGQGATELHLHPAGFEDPTRGPNAVAVAPGGAALVLDQLGERIVAIGATGEPQSFADAPMDAMELMANGSGTFAAFSKVRATAWFYDRSGAQVGTMSVPRSFLFLKRLSLDGSGLLRAHTSAQNTIRLGTATAPVDERTARSRRLHGAALLPNGDGVFLHVNDGQAKLFTLAQPGPEAERPTVANTHGIDGEVSAAHVIGTHDLTACMMLEQVQSTPEVNVARRAFCLNTATGAVVFDRALPPPGIYTPRSELALTGNRLAFINATDQGLRVMGWKLPASASETEVQP